MKLTFRWTDEPRPATRWKELFDRTWPSYRRWFVSEGDEERPDLDTCRAELRRHMPELVSTWESLVELTGGSEVAARMLTLVDPPAYVKGCSLAVRSGKVPILVRNYDYRPDACEGLFLRSRWLDTEVIASSDCLWGALDGVNGHGLSVALSFGGSRKVGPGFGIPLILRYVLECCATVDEAAAVLRRVPSHMAYNVGVLDAHGEYALAYLAPDRPPEVVRERVATNHQRRIDWLEYAARTGSEDRKRYLEEQLERRQSADRFVGRFLEPPLYTGDYARGHGTLYTAVYRPTDRTVEWLWPEARVHQSLDDFSDKTLTLGFGAKGREALVQANG